ncbi:MAG: outer membrane beta-barrel protein [Myxococcaceae bacterium]|nr:outer membrane beta-barrel protein [Myxococcaceae bacterium]
MKYISILGMLVGAGPRWAQGTSGQKPMISLEAGLGYNTNPYSKTDAQRAGKSTSDILFRMTPTFSFANQSKRLVLEAAGATTLAWLMGLGDNPGFLVFSGKVEAASSYHPNAQFSIFSRGGVMASRNLGELFVGNMTNLTGKLSVGETWRPGSGKLAWTVQGDYQAQGYPSISLGAKTTQPRILNNQSYGLSSRLAWQFLPKTAVFLEGGYGFFGSVDSNQVGVTTNPLHLGLGLSGRITEQLVLSSSASFSRILLRTKDRSLASTFFPIGFDAMLAWTPTKRSALGLSASRKMTPTPIYLDSVNHHFSLRYEQKLAQKYSFTLKPSFGLFEYGKPDTSLSSIDYRLDPNWVNRTDFFVETQLGLAYAMNEACSLGLAADGFWRWTNSNPDEAQILGPSGWVARGDGGTFESLYTRYQIHLFIRVVY